MFGRGREGLSKPSFFFVLVFVLVFLSVVGGRKKNKCSCVERINACD